MALELRDKKTIVVDMLPDGRIGYGSPSFAEPVISTRNHCDGLLARGCIAFPLGVHVDPYCVPDGLDRVVMYPKVRLVVLFQAVVDLLPQNPLLRFFPLCRRTTVGYLYAIVEPVI